MDKKVILLLIDSLMAETMLPLFKDGSIPALQFLWERGMRWKEAVTLFPTMTASVDSSLVTGRYPDQHKVPGLIWYRPEEREIINYVNSWKSVYKIGILKTAQNLLHHLNEKHLNKETATIFEELSKRGISSAAINAVIHRGPFAHPIRPPFLLRFMTGRKLISPVYGPERMTLGSLIPQEFHKNLSFWVKGPFQRYGINDAYALEATLYFLSQQNPPRFFFVYLPDHDHQVHKLRPKGAFASLRRVDEKIRRLLDFFPSWEEALEKAVFIVLGDHGQTEIGQEKRHRIDLDRLLSSFRLLPIGAKAKDEELVVANNERMAYLYPLKEGVLQRLLQVLACEEEMDLIAWKEDGGVKVLQGGERGNPFFFKPEGNLADPYGRKWTVCGEVPVGMASIEGEEIGFHQYPDLFSRLYGALYAQPIPVVVVTAAAFHELKSRFYPTHLGGASHGSLHHLDSYVPLIIAGSPLRFPLGKTDGEHPRILELKEYILHLLSPEG